MSNSRSTRRRGPPTLCRCPRCLAINPAGLSIPSEDAAQHQARLSIRRWRLSQSTGGAFGQQHASRSSNPAASFSDVGPGLNDGDGAPNDEEGGRGEDNQAHLDGQGRADGENHESPELHGGEDGIGRFSQDPEEPVDPDQDANAVEVEPMPNWLRLFGLLVLWLSCAKGLPRSCVHLLLGFVTDIVLAGRPEVHVRHIETVKRQVEYTPSLVKYAICPNEECQEVWAGSLAPELCNKCQRRVRVVGSQRPIKHFHYNSLTAYLRQCYQRPDFESKTNAWRTRQPGGELRDVYDGTAWSEDGFVDNRLHLRLSVGIDWFLPFSFQGTSTYSVAALSIRIDNLPVDERNRPENIHVAAILPGPRQSSDQGLEAAFRPLLQELSQLEDGIYIDTHGYHLARRMRARLWLALGDTPARAKLAGFPSHTQIDRWCGYCKADARSWVTELIGHEEAEGRLPDEHREHAFMVFQNPGLRTRMLKEEGATWTPLYNLPYWRSVSMVPVDAMHAVHLGVIKRFYYKTLIDGGMLRQVDAEFPIISEVLNTATYPRGVTSIRSNFGLPSAGSPTADSWSIFARFLMPLVLASHWATELQQDGSECFTSTNRCFRPPRHPGTYTFTREIKAAELLKLAVGLSRITHLVQRRVLSAEDIEALKHAIIDHVTSFATLLDSRWIVSNHHALMHLPEQIRRFGPPRGFWFYSLERLNGFLKNTEHNQHRLGELELSMQINHDLYRSMRVILNDLGDDPDEVAFRLLLRKQGVRMDPVEEEEDEVALVPSTTRFAGKPRLSTLDRPLVRELVSLIGRMRSAADPLAVAQDAWDGTEGQTLVGSSASRFDEIIVGTTRVTASNKRTNTAKGASNIVIATATGLRTGEFTGAFEHVFSHGSTGILVTRQYAQVLVYEVEPWPAQHAITSASASQLGYSLWHADESRRTVVLLADVVDTFVSASAKYLTGRDNSMFAARLRP